MFGVQRGIDKLSGSLSGVSSVFLFVKDLLAQRLRKTDYCIALVTLGSFIATQRLDSRFSIAYCIYIYIIYYIEMY